MVAKNGVNEFGFIGGTLTKQCEARRTLEEEERLNRRQLAQDRLLQCLGETLHKLFEFFVKRDQFHGSRRPTLFAAP